MEGGTPISTRLLGVLLALALAFACVAMLLSMLDLSGDPRCGTTAAQQELDETNALVVECFEGSAFQQTASQVFGWPCVAVAAIGAIMALFFAITGRHGRLVLRLTIIALVLGVLSLGLALI